MADDLDPSLLREDLRHLGPLIERYAESDNVERSTLLTPPPTRSSESSRHGGRAELQNRETS